MLAKRFIATILVADSWVIQSKQFKHTNRIGNAQTAIEFFASWDVDEIVILDVSRTDERHKEFLKIVEDFGDRCFVPLSVGGWNRTIDDIRDCLNAGADKVIINTQAYLSPEFITSSAKKFGSQCIVISIDYLHNMIYLDRGRWAICNNTPLDWAKKVETLGAGEIYLTSIERDGMGEGYDIDTIAEISKAVNIPIIVSGGVGKWDHLVDGLNAGADAVSVANRLHYSEHSVKEAKDFLMNTNYPIRPAIFFEI